MKEVIFCVSDVELGDGTVMDDFVADELYASTIRKFTKKYANEKIVKSRD